MRTFPSVAPRRSNAEQNLLEISQPICEPICEPTVRPNDWNEQSIDFGGKVQISTCPYIVIYRGNIKNIFRVFTFWEVAEN